MFVSSRYLFSILPQQCAYCRCCRLDIQTRTQELLCPLKGVVITRTSTIYQHCFRTKELYGKQFNHLQAAQVKHHTSTAVPGSTTNQNGGLYDNIRQKQINLLPVLSTEWKHPSITATAKMRTHRKIWHLYYCSHAYELIRSHCPLKLYTRANS